MKKLLFTICAAITINSTAVDLNISQNYILATHTRPNGNMVRMTKNLQSNEFTYSEESPQEEQVRRMQFWAGVTDLRGAFIFPDPGENPLDITTQDPLYRRIIRTINHYQRLYEQDLQRASFSTEVINAQDDFLERAKDRVRMQEDLAQRDLIERIAYAQKERLEQLIEQLLPKETTQKLKRLRSIRNRLHNTNINTLKNTTQIELNNMIIEAMVALTRKQLRAPKDHEIVNYITQQYQI